MNAFSSTDRPLRILVTRTDRIGDFVLSTPVFKALREKYPQAWIAGLTFAVNRDLIQGNPYLDEVILYDKGGRERGVWGNALFAWNLARKNFDGVIHLHATNRMHVVTWLAGIPKRTGWGRRAKWTLTQCYPYRKPEGLKHEAVYNFELLSEFDIECPQNLETHFPIQKRWQPSLDELLEQKGLKRDKPWVVFNPSASDTSKMWPLENFCRVADKVHETYDVYLAVIGSKKDAAHVHGFLAGTEVPVTDLGSLLSLSTLGLFLKESKLLISNDSGPVHIAQALGTDVISIFHRRQDPGLSPTRWRPLYANSSVLAGEDVAVEEVLHETNRWLSASKKVPVVS